MYKINPQIKADMHILPNIGISPFLSERENICIYNILSHKINDSSRTKSNILIIVENFQQNNLGNFQQ